ncbi:MAG: hypothetical protein ABI625_12590 [bacterium]
MAGACAGNPSVSTTSTPVVAVAPVAPPLAWRTDRVGGSSPFYEVIDTSGAGHALTLRHMIGGGTMNGEFGTATTSAPADTMVGQRVTVRAELRTRNSDGATLWIRAEGKGKTLRLENNMAHPIFAQDWMVQTAVLDLPDGTERISYGLLLQGAGEVSIRGLTISHAPPTGAPVTGLP